MSEYELPQMPEQPKPTHEYGTILWPDAEILIRKDDACPRCERVKEVIEKLKRRHVGALEVFHLANPEYGQGMADMKSHAIELLEEGMK